MLLTVTTTYEPATDLGYLLHKHPNRLQSFEESVGVAHVFYPERTPGRCTAALLLEVDPVALVRGRRNSPDAFSLGQYVNDRPYAASSMLALALKDVFRSALSGQCKARPELAATALPLELHIPALPCRAGRTWPADSSPRWGGTSKSRSARSTRPSRSGASRATST